MNEEIQASARLVTPETLEEINRVVEEFRVAFSSKMAAISNPRPRRKAVKNVLSALFAALMLSVLPAAALAWTPITITRVIDGDTIAARFSGTGDEIRIRLYGIDAPEKKQPFGQAATRELQSLLAGGNAEMETKDKDRYGRIVALIRVGGRDINERMIMEGYAWVYTKYCRESFCGSWRSYEEAARAAGRGLWRDKNPVPPWEWRHPH